MKIKLDNMDHDDGMVTVYCHDQAAAENDQTIDGSSWECPSDMTIAYAIVVDRAGLVADLESEGYEVDQTEYCAPEPGRCLVCREDSGGPKNMTCGSDECRAAVYGDDADDAETQALLTYSINVTDSDVPSAWMRLADAITPGAQDSGRCAFRAVVAYDRHAALEAALEADPDVLEYYRVTASYERDGHKRR